MKFYHNKIIWITGASSGIGRALAIEFSRQGASLILSARNNEALIETRSLCADHKNVKLLTLDLQEIQTFEEKTKEAISLFDGLDILINNGGVSQRGFANETPLVVDRKIFEINYFGTIGLTKAVLPYFIKNKKGQIAVTSSVVGKFGSPVRTAYAASKHALHGFFDSLRAELYDENIGVTIICPGPINTAISENALTASGDKQNKKDEAIAGGMNPEVLAKKYIKALKKNKREAWIGKKEVFAIYVKRFFPGLFARIIRNVKVT